MRQTRTTTSRIKSHLPLVEECASVIAAEARSHHYGAEWDDLRQEGMIAVWQSDKEGDDLEGHILKCMAEYVSWLGKQRGAARGS